MRGKYEESRKVSGRKMMEVEIDQNLGKIYVPTYLYTPA